MSEQHQSLRFRRLLSEFGARVYAHAFRMLRDRREAEEATQDVFMKVYRGLEGFREESKLSTWIFRITMNTCLDRLSRVRRETISFDDNEALIAEYLASGEDPEELYSSQESAERLATLIGLLPPLEGEAIVLYYYEEESYEEIGNIMGIPAGTVATLLHRGRLHLHSLMSRSTSGEYRQ